MIINFLIKNNLVYGSSSNVPNFIFKGPYLNRKENTMHVVNIYVYPDALCTVSVIKIKYNSMFGKLA